MKKCSCGGYIAIKGCVVTRISNDWTRHESTVYKSAEAAKAAFKVAAVDGRSKGGNTRRDYHVAVKGGKL